MAIAQAHGGITVLDCDDWITPDATEASGEGGKRGTGGSCDLIFYRGDRGEAVVS